MFSALESESLLREKNSKNGNPDLQFDVQDNFASWPRAPNDRVAYLREPEHRPPKPPYVSS
jgi:hypothetical protein